MFFSRWLINTTSRPSASVGSCHIINKVSDIFLWPRNWLFRFLVWTCCHLFISSLSPPIFFENSRRHTFIDVGRAYSDYNEEATSYIMSVIRFYRLPWPQKLNGEGKTEVLHLKQVTVCLFFCFSSLNKRPAIIDKAVIGDYATTASSEDGCSR